MRIRKSWLLRCAKKLSSENNDGINKAINACVLDLKFNVTCDETIQFIRKIVSDASAKGVVVGLIGGFVSSFVATPCVRSLGKENVLGILVPTNFTPRHDMENALKLSQWLGI